MHPTRRDRLAPAIHAGAMAAAHGLGTPGPRFLEYRYGIVMIAGGLTLPAARA